MKKTTSKILRTTIIIMGVAICLFMLRYCAITRTVGPFMGKIVDVETKEPLEGAVVLVWFHTRAASPGGSVASIADVFEALTNANGEFMIPKTRVTPFKPFESWGLTGFEFSIFKPGYGVYPRHPKAFRSPELDRFWHISENEHNTYFLPKLLTIEERYKNLSEIEMPSCVETDKIIKLRRLESQERVVVGLKPFSFLKKYGEKQNE